MVPAIFTKQNETFEEKQCHKLVPFPRTSCCDYPLHCYKEGMKELCFYIHPVLNILESHQILMYILQVLHFTN